MRLKNNQKVTMTGRQIKKLKENATNHAVKVTQLLPLWVLRTKYGFGKKRLLEFSDHYADLMESYSEGYLDLEDIMTALEDETGINFYEESKM